MVLTLVAGVRKICMRIACTKVHALKTPLDEYHDDRKPADRLFQTSAGHGTVAKAAVD